MAWLSVRNLISDPHSADRKTERSVVLQSLKRPLNADMLHYYNSTRSSNFVFMDELS